MDLLRSKFKQVRMIINITSQDIWNEFVYYRKSGHAKTAFKHIRPYGTASEWEGLIAGIAHHKYNLKIGDVIKVEGTSLEFVWEQSLDAMFCTASDWDTPENGFVRSKVDSSKDS
jgi:hypothetical protein